MAYTKQNFENGQTLTADHLNNMESAIKDNETAISRLSDTLSEEKADKEFVVSIFEQLKALIEAGKTDEAIAVLDEAILDLAVLA